MTACSGHVVPGRLRTDSFASGSARLARRHGADAGDRPPASKSQGLGLFVRSLVGMDREAAKSALSGFLNGEAWSASQIEFLNLIVNHLTEHGVMEVERLYESPFTDLTPRLNFPHCPI